jgi:hypothetical protein
MSCEASGLSRSLGNRRSTRQLAGNLQDIVSPRYRLFRNSNRWALGL